MPLAYAGAVLFPLAIGGLRSSAQSRERWIFLAFVLLGFAYGASAPLLLDATSSLPGFALALNYRLVFLAPLGLAGLAALGADRIVGTEAARRLATAALLIAVALTVGYLSSWRVYESRELPDDFLRESIALEVVPVVGLAIAAAWLRKRPAGLGAVALTLLVGQRFLEMRETYPTLRAGSLAPPLPVLAALPPAAEPRRIVATGARTVVTGNPGCLMQIGAGLMAARLPIGVAHPVELLDWSYERAGMYEGAGAQGRRDAGAGTQGPRDAGATMQGRRDAGAGTQGPRDAGATTQGPRDAGATTQGRRDAGTHGCG